MSNDFAQQQRKIFAENLNYHMKRLGFNQDDIVKALGYSSSTISDWCNAKKYPRVSKMQELADYLGVSLFDLREPREKKEPAVPPGFQPMPKMVKRPLVGQIACGDPIMAEENIEAYVDVPEDIDCDFVLTCSGDSMIDAGISDGDQVYIHIQPEVENGQIAAVRIGNDATLKRVYWDGTTLMLMPANAKYPPKSFSGEDLNEIQIEGRAVGFTHWF